MPTGAVAVRSRTRCGFPSRMIRFFSLICAWPLLRPPASLARAHVRSLFSGGLIERSEVFRRRWGGAGGRNRTGTGLCPNGFSYPYGFHRRPLRAVCGLDYPFTLAPSRFRCCPSSLYTFPEAAFAAQGLARGCHFTGFPEFEQFYIAGFPARTQFVV